ncbi:hypothetical protein AAMO2058_000068400 [Amorphochlora amoebiformis]
MELWILAWILVLGVPAAAYVTGYAVYYLLLWENSKVRRNMSNLAWNSAKTRHGVQEEGERRAWCGRQQFFSEYLHTIESRPVCFTGIVSEWKAISKWNLDFFSDVAHDVPVTVSRSRNEENCQTIKRFSTLRRFAQELRQSIKGSMEELNAPTGSQVDESSNPVEVNYLKQVDLNKIQGLGEDIVSEPEKDVFGPWSIFGTRYLWIGTKGSMTGMHNDDENNILCQIKGSKTVILYPPYMKSYLRPNGKYDSGTVCCEYDAFTEAHLPGPSIKFHLSKGDLLFIPKYWYHQVLTTSKISISVNHFSSTPLEFFLFGIPRLFLIFAHNLGLYGRSRGCVCHQTNQLNQT